MTAGPTGTATLEPLPPPEADTGAAARLGPRRWVRENLFSSPLDSVLTVIFGLLLAYVVYRGLRFALVSGRWEIIRVNLTNFAIGRFPREQIPRLWAAIFVAAAGIGLGSGMAASAGPTSRPVDTFRRLAPLAVLVAVLLSLARTPTPALLTLCAVAALVGAHLLGRRLPTRLARRVPWVYLGTVLVIFVVLTQFGGVAWNAWGGLLLTLFLAVAGIALSFPIGVLLALGRRSSFPAVRVVCVGYIELIRGVPLITLLFMAGFALGFFLPVGVPRPGLVTRALVAFVAFTAAYIAEIVRGGLQGVPPGQVEAAQAIGLSPLKTTRLIVLPQALRNVIPALVGQFISLFKDTSLVSFLAVLEILSVAQLVTQQDDFRGQSLQAEALVFVSFVYWTFCYAMSRASQRLERRLAVGER